MLGTVGGGILVTTTTRNRHGRDEDCTVGPDGCCTGCGVAHAAPCHVCGGRGYHCTGCTEVDGPSTDPFLNERANWREVER